MCESVMLYTNCFLISNILNRFFFIIIIIISLDINIDNNVHFIKL